MAAPNHARDDFLFFWEIASAAVNSALAAALFEVPFVRNRQPVPINRAEIEAHYTEVLSLFSNGVPHLDSNHTSRRR